MKQHEAERIHGAAIAVGMLCMFGAFMALLGWPILKLLMSLTPWLGILFVALALGAFVTILHRLFGEQ